MTNPQLRGTPFSVTAAGTTSAQAVTGSGTVTYYVTDISGSSTTNGTWALLCGAAGTTILWNGSGAVNATFSNPIRSTTGTIGFLMNGATVTYANVSGFSIP